MYRLGIDVGGTNTDAVILNEQQAVVSQTKTHTTSDIQSGIIQAIHSVMQASAIDPQQVKQAMLGTTQATNAIVERKNLSKVGVLRIGYPATASITPYTLWPADLVEILSGTAALVHGGYEFNGDPLVKFDEQEVAAVIEKWRDQVEAIAIVGVFSSIHDEQEKEVANLVHQILGNKFPVTLSSEIGSSGLIGRENATILNAALFNVIAKVTQGFAAALKVEGVINAKAYLCQNDGTLMTLDYARNYPILTIGSGPTNSIRGAAYLSGQKDALVIDIGGTTADIGALVNGFPRQSSKAVNVGGVETSFRMPDILSVGLGGGSIVRKRADGSMTIGPDSVGYQITKKAKVFGGDTLTTTDIAVRLGLADLGDANLVADLSIQDAQAALAIIQQMLANGIDQMKTNSEDIPVILVGGGAIIAPEKLAGVRQIVTNNYGGVANAIGATIAQIGGETEKMYQYVNINREQALQDATKSATQQAVAAGADSKTVTVVEILETPLAYAPGETTKVKVKVVGDAN